ncbi:MULTISPECIES: RNA polymerase factor sigma-54 [Fusobacterium]|uniref:RNA polymerase factor sigma-54 n=1 Tax=Fusobacterium TaxID=848 RepID=UPI0014771239|nr:MULTISPECIES: RNA polymerase factor sigma-54 [Fusobacterium]NME36762.1 RNA polymerase factor sigma-54 [Fusobacterium sp. FSA-380-WT-3A]
MDFSLNLKQDLKLVLTQEMKVSLNILEMSSYDLEKYILKEKEINPYIEVEYTSINRKNFSDDEEEFSPLDIAHKEESLIDYLEEQIGYLKINKSMRFLCSYIINNLDKRGYLLLKKQEIKDLTKFPLKEIEKAIEIVKSLEPVGIGAQNLEECLIIQLHKKQINDIVLENLIKYFLRELAEGKVDKICEKLKITSEQLKKYFEMIRKLNPIPSRGFYMGEPVNYISPEAEIKLVDGEYKVIMLYGNLPKVKIKEVENIDKTYYNSANNLIKFIEKRYETLKNILEVILERQYEYFSQENGKLKNLTLKEVAEKLEIHESTISRAIKNKYISSDKGILRIKDLFVLNDEKEMICEIIENLILEEDREKPYTDQYMADYINLHNFKIARRTVAKYREELGIASASKRKLKNI